MFLGEIFQILTQTINDWPNPTRVKKFEPDQSLQLISDFKKIKIKKSL